MKLMDYPARNRENETFEKRSILFKIKAREDFNRRNMLNISRIKIRTQRRDWAKGDVFQRSQNGFSLIELLFAMGIFMIILAAITSAFISQRKSYDVQEQIAEMTQGARSAMDMLSTEIRLAGYRLPDAEFGMPYSTSQLQLFADLNGDGDTLDPNENIIYTYDGTNLRINRKDFNTEDVAYPFAENIEGFSFTYFEGDGATEVTSTDDDGKIRQIKIKIAAQTSEADPDYSSNSGYRIVTLTSRVTPINLGL